MSRTHWFQILILTATLSVLPARAQVPLGTNCDPATLTADFAQRDKLPESRLSRKEWYRQDWNYGWGPLAAIYPAVRVPPGCDPTNWKRDRVIAVARKYIGLKYRHHHIPAWDPAPSLTGETNSAPGLDCSNFSSWVYNYGLGIKFTSDVEEQADGAKAPGRKLKPNEPLQPGDLMFILVENRSRISHVVIYVDPEHIIDSHGKAGGVTEHTPVGWYKTHFAFARRVIE